jgi:hypothetical protein
MLPIRRLRTAVVSNCGVLLFLSLFLAAGCGNGPGAIERRADALIRRNLSAEAIQLVRAELTKSPKDPRLLALLGRVQLKTGDVAGADSAFRVACGVDTAYFDQYVSAFIAQGGEWAAQGRESLAAQAFTNAMERDPTASGRIAAALVGAGTRLLLSDRPGADRAFSAASQYDPSSRGAIARAHFVFAKTLLAGNPAASAEELGRAAAWDPGLDGQVGEVVGAAIAGDDKAVAALLPLAERLGPAGHEAFLRKVAGRRHSVQVTVTVPAGWTPCPFELQAGDTVILEPRGTVRAEAGREGWVSDPCGPAGWPAKSMDWWEDEAGALLSPGFPRLALLARVGGGRPFAVAAPRTWVADAAGHLNLAVNDVPQRARQGAGSFTVRVDAPLSAYRVAREDALPMEE